MKKDELFLKRTGAEILAELERISRIMKEYREFIDLYREHMDKYQLRVKASFMADFYMGAEKIFEIISIYQADTNYEIASLRSQRRLF